MDYPLFWKLPAKSQAVLMKWHYDTFGTKLNIPPEPNISSKYDTRVEDPEELEVIMREKPNPRRVD